MNKLYRAEKKRPVAVLGETRPACPDKGCVGEEPGKVITLYNDMNGPSRVFGDNQPSEKIAIIHTEI